MTKKRLSANVITKMAFLAALLCSSAYISVAIPFTPVVITFQTMIINLISILLTPTESFITILVYTIIGLIGIPVFSGGTGGVGRLFGPTGGYILAFIVAVPVMSFTKVFFARIFKRFIKNETLAKTIAYSVNAILVGMVLILGIGTVYMKLTYVSGTSAATWGGVIAIAVLPFLPLDIVKCIAAAVIGVRLEKIHRLSER